MEDVYVILVEKYQQKEAYVLQNVYLNFEQARIAARLEFNNMYNNYMHFNMDNALPFNVGEDYFEVEDLFSVSISKRKVI